MSAKGQWEVTHEEEEEYRRKLMMRARKGDAKAQDELMSTYGVRLYSERERAQLIYENPKAGRAHKRKSMHGSVRPRT